MRITVFLLFVLTFFLLLFLSLFLFLLAGVSLNRGTRGLARPLSPGF